MIIQVESTGYEVALHITETEMRDFVKWIDTKNEDEDFDEGDPEYTVWKLIKGMVKV